MDNLIKRAPLDLKASIPLALADTRIHQLEVEHDLLQYKIDNWCVWPLLRFGAVLALQNLPLTKGNRIGFKHLLPIAIKDMVSLALLRSSRYLAIGHTSNRSEQENGLFKDIFFDELLLTIGDYYKLEHLDNILFAPANQKALIKSDTTSTALRIFARLLAKSGSPSYISPIVTQLSTCFKTELGIDTFTFERIRQFLVNFYWAKKLYGLLLRQVRPKFLLLVTAYSDHALVAAAKELGIKVIEFQHGFINRYHPGYSWSTYALPYKTTMPIPDRLFLYGKYWQQELEINGFWQKELYSTGSLRMEKYRQFKATIQPTDPYNIVLTTQGLDTEKLITFIADFLRLADIGSSFCLNIKLHPTERSKEPYEALLGTDKRVRILLGNESPSTFELLSKAHLHLSISSTCHYEALGLGVPTILLPFATHEDILSICTTGYAFLVETPQDLVDLILKINHSQVPAEVGAYYFETNVLANMRRELRL